MVGGVDRDEDLDEVEVVFEEKEFKSKEINKNRDDNANPNKSKIAPKGPSPTPKLMSSTPSSRNESLPRTPDPVISPHPPPPPVVSPPPPPPPVESPPVESLLVESPPPVISPPPISPVFTSQQQSSVQSRSSLPLSEEKKIVSQRKRLPKSPTEVKRDDKPDVRQSTFSKMSVQNETTEIFEEEKLEREMFSHYGSKLSDTINNELVSCEAILIFSFNQFLMTGGGDN